jgi:hypothetical protein
MYPDEAATGGMASRVYLNNVCGTSVAVSRLFFFLLPSWQQPKNLRVGHAPLVPTA